MDAKTVFTKTAKGLTQVSQKTQSLSRQLTKVLKAIDGRSSVSALSDKVDLAIPALEKDLAQLKKDGFIKIFEVRFEEPMSGFGGDDDDDFDFTAPAKMSAALKEPVAAFGPSKYRSPGQNEQVARAETPAPSRQDEATEIAAAIAARKKQEEAARIAAEALAAARASAQKAQAEARARAEREAQIRARLEVEAKARKEAETRAIEEAKRAEIAAAKSRADLEARLAEETRKRAEIAASTQRLTEVQQAEQAAAQKALSEARAKAEAEAKAFAAARAKIESETKALSEARALAEAASKRQEEELASAQRALRTQLKAEIEAKVRAEMEELLKSDLEESGRAEVEAAIRAEARDEARRQLEEQLGVERSSLAKIEAEAKERAEVDAQRMLADQEARLRAEMEARLAEIAAEKAQVEIEARKMAEAQAAAAAAAAAEFAARLKAEEEARRVAEVEAEARRERDAAERQRLEAIAREEAVARAKAAAEAKAAADAAAAMAERLKAESAARAEVEAAAEERRKAETLRASRLEARARDEAEQRQRSEAEMQAKLTAEKQARIEAQAKALLDAESREKALRESAAELESEKRSREEAEERALRESKAREIASRAVEQQVAEKEKLAALAEQRIAEEREARERAEAKAYADERAEEAYRLAQVARLKELTEQAERTANQPAEVVDGKRKRPKIKKEIPIGTVITFSIAAVIVLAVVLVQVVPLGAVNTKLEKALATWVHDDVSSANLRVALFPKPHVKLDQISLGKTFDAKAASGKLYMDIGSIFGDKFVIDLMELNDVSVSAEALPRALKWADAEGRGSQIEIDKIVLNGVKLEVKGLNLEAFDAELKFDRKGKISHASARTRDGKWSLETFVDAANPPPEGGVQPWVVDFAARNWTPPLGPGIPFAVLGGKGSWSDNQIFFPVMEAKLLEGSATGNLRITLPSSPVAKGQLMAQSEFTIARAKVDQLVGAFTRDIALSGRMEGSFVATALSSSVGTLLDSPVVVGALQVREGTMSNLDLVQAMRNPGSVGGQTKYAELATKVRVADNVIRFESLKLSGGVLFAGGNFSVATDKGALSGTLTAEIRSNVAQDRAVFGLSGTVARPVLKRGG
jgi:hypothetical protein